MKKHATARAPSSPVRVDGAMLAHPNLMNALTTPQQNTLLHPNTPSYPEHKKTEFSAKLLKMGGR